MIQRQRKNRAPDAEASTGVLAIIRTTLANERTFLSFLRTALGLFLGGIGLIKFWGHPLVEVLGWVFIAAAAVLLGIGIFRYRYARRVLVDVTPENWKNVEEKIDPF